jgi:hypothetical protein
LLDKAVSVRRGAMVRALATTAALILSASLVSGCSQDDLADDGVTNVLFDGTTCTVSPTTAPSGDRAFVLTNTSDMPIDSNAFFVIKVPDGYRFDDLLEIQEENGGAPRSIPEDIWYVTLAVENEGLSFAAGPDVELGEDQTLHMRTLTPGSDAIELYLEGPPELQWLCGPIEVTEQS